MRCTWNMQIARKRIALVLVVVGLSACSARPGVWESAIASVRTAELASALALVDDGAHRAILLRPGSNLELQRSFVGVGRGVVQTATSADRKQLFVLSVGDQPRRKASDESPSLTIIDTGSSELGAAPVVRRVELRAPLSGLSVDPSGRWLAVYPAGTGNAFIENPNQLVLVDLQAPLQNAPVFRTLRSFGGRPQRITFSPELLLPGGARRLLVVETDQDLSLLDLAHVQDASERPEITVRLTNGQSARALVPAGVAFDNGDPNRDDDARIAVRISNDANLVMLTLANKPSGSTAPNDFAPTINLADLGGTATDMAFVRTDAGVRVAALVPSQKKAVLVDPATSLTTDVAFPEGYTRLSAASVSPGQVPEPQANPSDTALLYGGASSVAFWALGRTSAAPYRSVEVVNLAFGAQEIVNVPAPNADLKVLASPQAGFYVLNLRTRTAQPLNAQTSAKIVVSQDGQRLWAYADGTKNLAQIPFATLAPVPLPQDRPIRAVFELSRADSGGALLALDTRGTYGVTVLDAAAPNLRNTRSYFGLLLEGL
jgi:hypothetical protein